MSADFSVDVTLSHSGGRPFSAEERQEIDEPVSKSYGQFVTSLQPGHECDLRKWHTGTDAKYTGYSILSLYASDYDGQTLKEHIEMAKDLSTRIAKQAPDNLGLYVR